MFCPVETFDEAGDHRWTMRRSDPIVSLRMCHRNRRSVPIGGDRHREAPGLHAVRPMTPRQWSRFVVLGSVIISSGTLGCARTLVRSSPGVVGSIPSTVPGVPLGAPDHTSADAQRRPRDNADGVRPSPKANNDKKRRSIAAGREGLDRGLPTSAFGTAAAGGGNWSVVVTTPAPALDDGARGPAVASGTTGLASPPRRDRARSGLGLTAAMAIVLALIAAIVVVPKFLDKAIHSGERPRA